jgi:hypothetical protein
MPYSVLPDFVVSPQPQGKPKLTSYDSGQECSFAHWLEVRRLVELADREDPESKGYVFDDSLLVSQ